MFNPQSLIVAIPEHGMKKENFAVWSNPDQSIPDRQGEKHDEKKKMTIDTNRV
jgi:hypothetical protein